MMTKLLSRRDEVGDRLEFFEFLEELVITEATRIAYAEQFMFKHRASLHWTLMAQSDSTLLLKFAQAPPKTPTDRDARGRGPGRHANGGQLVAFQGCRVRGGSL